MNLNEIFVVYVLICLFDGLMFKLFVAIYLQKTTFNNPLTWLLPIGWLRIWF